MQTRREMLGVVGAAGLAAVPGIAVAAKEETFPAIKIGDRTVTPLKVERQPNGSLIYSEYRVDEKEDTRYLKGELLHRVDGPALIRRIEGRIVWEAWYLDGLPHRIGGPSLITNDSIYYHRHGKLHNDKGPAEIFSDGTKKWYREGILHNEDGPAIIDYNGKSNNKPALYWYLNGALVRSEMYGVTRFVKEGKLHNENGPALIHANGTIEYYYEGRLHKETGPAVIAANGKKSWFIHGHIRKTEHDHLVAFYENDKLVYSATGKMAVFLSQRL